MKEEEEEEEEKEEEEEVKEEEEKEEEEDHAFYINHGTYIFIIFVQQCFISTELWKTNLAFHCFFLETKKEISSNVIISLHQFYLNIIKRQQYSVRL